MEPRKVKRLYLLYKQKLEAGEIVPGSKSDVMATRKQIWLVLDEFRAGVPELARIINRDARRLRREVSRNLPGDEATSISKDQLERATLRMGFNRLDADDRNEIQEMLTLVTVTSRP